MLHDALPFRDLPDECEVVACTGHVIGTMTRQRELFPTITASLLTSSKNNRQSPR